ncbi:MAG TPA: proton-conducting transporter membrane subunit [Anaerolineae bacterium]
MPLSDAALESGLLHITAAVTVLFGLGFASGVYRRIAPSRFLADEERDKTLTLYASLVFAVLGGMLAATAAGWYLFAYCSSATCEPATASLWQNEIVSGLRLSASLYVDRLAAFFVLLISALSIGVSVYSFGWLAGDDQRNRVAGFYNLFVLALLCTVVVNHVFFLILALEVATLAFGYLILYKHNRYPEVEEHQRAITAYLVISQISTALILAAFLVLALHARGQFCPEGLSQCNVDIFDLGTFRGTADRPRLNLGDEPLAATLVFLLAFGGLSIRAGAFPLHFWVSLAHPSSPTTTHAMSLGIGIKIALYLMLRVFFEFLYPAAAWWGWLVLIIGGVTAAYNVFFASLAHDLKRALAYHSVENIGIILAGIGLALAASAGGAPIGLVEIGLVAALYHLLNHTVFKSLLYLCTGIIEKRTGGAVLLRELGGVWRYYPWTASAFLIGAIAIAGLPPFNGFVSEWLTLAGLFGGLNSAGQNEDRVLALIALAAGILLLALAFSLTALAFVKIAGRSLLGSPHKPEIWDKAQKGDAPLNMLGVVGVLAGLCLMLGLLAQPVTLFLAGIARSLGARNALVWNSSTLSIGEESTTMLSLLPIFTLAALTALVLIVAWLRMKHARRGRVWVGGAVYDARRMQYTGAAFTYWLWSHFSRREPSPESTGSTQTRRPDYVYARMDVSAQEHIVGPLRSAINTFLDFSATLSERVGSRVQSGSLRGYLLYMLGAFFLALLLLWLTRS